MDSNLKSYQSLYASLTAEITANLSKISQNLKSATIPEDAIDTKTLLERVDKNFEDATELFEQMELEIRELPSPEERSRQLNHMQSFKAELKRLEREYSLTKRRVQRHEDRSKLLDDEELDTSHLDSDMSHNAKDRLIENTETMERSSRKLDQGRNLLEETQSVGASVLSDLENQRETLMRSRNRLRDTDDDLGTGSRVLSVMIMKVQRSRIVMAGVALAIIVIILVSIYLSFYG